MVIFEPIAHGFARATVAIESQHIRVGRPQGLKPPVFSGNGSGQRGKPHIEAIARAGGIGGSRQGRAVILHDGGHSGAAIAVKGHGVLVDRPLGVQRHRGPVLGGQAAYALAVLVGRAAAVRRGVPPGEAVALPGKGVVRQVTRLTVGEIVRTHGARAAVGVKADAVLDGRPQRREHVVRGGHGVGQRRVPAAEGVARAGGSGRGRQGRAVIQGDGGYRRAAEGVKAQGIRIDRPFGVEGLVPGGARGDAGHRCAVQPLVVIPAAEAVARADGGGQGRGRVVVVGGGVGGRVDAAVQLVGDIVGAHRLGVAEGDLDPGHIISFNCARLRFIVVFCRMKISSIVRHLHMGDILAGVLKE